MSRPLCALCIALLALPAVAQERPGREYPPVLPGAVEEVYRSIDGVELKLYIFNAKEQEEARPVADGEQPAAPTRKPAIVFFFGGGWRNGSPQQFATQAQYLAERGMTAICADYRVSSRHDVTPLDCVEDAKAAIRYVRENAARLGIDPNRIAAGGGSAGGHLAAATGVVPGFEPADAAISSRPNALVLFNPALQLAPFGDDAELGSNVIARMDERTGGRAKEISPLHHVGKDEPPTLVLHGVDDKTVPFATVQRFGQEMRKQGNRCVVVGFKGQGHGFFNNRRGNATMSEATIRQMDEFLISLGWLQGEPTLAMSVPEEELVREQ